MELFERSLRGRTVIEREGDQQLPSQAVTSFFKMEASNRPHIKKSNSYVREIMKESTDTFAATLDTIVKSSPLQRAFADIQHPAIQCLTDTLKCVINLKSTIVPSGIIQQEGYEEFYVVNMYTNWAKTDDDHLEAKYKIKNLLRKYCKYDNPATRAKDFDGDLKFYMKTPFEFKTFESFFRYCQLCWDSLYVRKMQLTYEMDYMRFTKKEREVRFTLVKAFEHLAYNNFEKALLQI